MLHTHASWALQAQFSESLRISEVPPLSFAAMQNYGGF